MDRLRFGRWGAVTALTPIRRGRDPWLRLVLLFGSLTTIAVRPLLKMRVIALGRWTILPRAGQPDVMVFETHWSGGPQSWESYVPDFGRIMPWQWRFIWGATERFPGPLPVTHLMRWVDEIDYGADHFYCGYGERSTTHEVALALELRPRLARFARDVDGVGPDEFARRFERFADEVQDLV